MNLSHQNQINKNKLDNFNVTNTNQFLKIGTNCISAKAEKKIIEQFQNLTQEAKSLDFKLNKLAFEIRSHFRKDNSGELAFKAWIIQKLHVTSSVSGEYVLRARTYALFSEEDQKAMGGWNAISQVKHLPPVEQVKVLSKAKEEKKPVYTAMKDEGHAPDKGHKERDVKPRANAWNDAKKLSEYISRIKPGLKGVPKDVKELIERYVVAVKLKTE